MKYKHEERIEVIRQAYSGLFQLVSGVLFDKYVDFIDTYAEISKEEQESIYHEIIEHKETAMLAQYIRERGRKEGIEQGIERGIERGIQQGIHQGIVKKAKEDVIEILKLRFGNISSEIIENINQIDDPARLKELFKQGIQIKAIDSFRLN